MRSCQARPWGILFLALATAGGCAVRVPAAGSPVPTVATGASPGGKLGEVLTVAAVDPLQKVFRESSFFPDEKASAAVARGEYASFQFVLRSGKNIRGLAARVGPVRSGEASLAAASARFVGYVKVSRRAPEPSHDRLVSLSGYYPDPLLERASVDVPRDCAQPVWITVPVPKDAVPGRYEGQVTFSGTIEGRPFRAAKAFEVNVFPVTVAATRLWVTNWFFTDPATLKVFNGGRDVEEDSPRYWELVRTLAGMMREYRQNVAWVHPLDLVKFSMDGDRWGFDFEDFDRMVGLFIEAGVIGRIEGGHIGGRESTWESPFVVNVPVLKSEGTVLEKRPLADPAAAAFYRQFIPALADHLRAKGWDGIYLQHIADEPIAVNAKSYVEIASFIKGLTPGLKVVEACHSKDVENTVDVWVPQLDFLSTDFDFYRARQQAGDELWFYTCLAPQGEFPNRFIELPLIKTRYVHWLNFRYGATGYLHWGFNFWRNAGEGDPYGETTGVILESGNTLPGGDSWIVYPENGKVLSSIRLEAMREGIFDYELLKMLEEKQPDKAAEICRNRVFSFTNCDLDIASFRRARTALLELLSK